MRRSLISFDTDRIKEYVFATGDLKEIRGASGILDELNRKETERVIKRIDPTAEKIYANGGSAMFEADEADLCIQAVENLYSAETVTGSISGAFQSADNSLSFKEIIKTLNYKLRTVKDSSKSSLKPVTHPFLRTCDSCGNEYAGYQGDDKKVICLSCKKKREKDLEVKNNIEAILSGRRIKPVAERYEIWDRLLPELMESKDYDTEGKDRPESFNQIGDLSSPSGYMGLIYADGDSMGDKLEQLESEEEEVKEFSETVDQAIFQALLRAIEKHLHPNKEDQYFPFDILMLGGDDLVMVTVAEKAVETAMTIMDIFEEITKEYAVKKFGKPLTISVGVTIAHAKFPFGSFLKLTEDLLKFAKKKGKGRINFQVVNAGNSLNFSEDYKNLFKHKENMIKESRKFVRTLRPYDTETLRHLIEQIRNLKKGDFPRNKLQPLREAVFSDYGYSTLTGLAVYSRLKEQRGALKGIFEAVANTDGDIPIVWFKKDDSYYTPFLDVAELYDFIPGGE